MIDVEDAFVLHRGRTHDVAALRGMTLRVAAGERIVVRGPSGSGKSTLVAAVSGQVMASAGRVRLFGHDLAQLDHAAALKLRTAHVGVVSQRSGLDLIDDFDCLENVALQARLGGVDREEGRRSARAALTRLGLDHLAHRRPASLSGGERQRVALAAALAHGPGLVIADEPTGELDAVSADQVYDFLRDHAVRTGAALLVVTHDSRAERIATRVLTIHDGRLSEEAVDGRTALVVDDRGWVRLPDVLRTDAGIVGRVVAAVGDRQISLLGLQPVASTVTTAPMKSQGTPISDDPVVVMGDAEIDLDATTIGPVSMELRRGQVTVLTGRSGSGKTSVLSIILGASEPTRGVVQRHFASFGCSPQTAAFADQQSVDANVDLVRALRSEPADDTAADVLEALGLAGLADRPTRALSGGERQRTGVARALAVEADLVVLDEPTSQLDRATARLMSRAILECARGGACVVCASHDEEILGIADQIIDLGVGPGPLGVTCQ